MSSLCRYHNRYKRKPTETFSWLNKVHYIKNYQLNWNVNFVPILIHFITTATLLLPLPISMNVLTLCKHFSLTVVFFVNKKVWDAIARNTCQNKSHFRNQKSRTKSIKIRNLHNIILRINDPNTSYIHMYIHRRINPTDLYMALNWYKAN